MKGLNIQPKFSINLDLSENPELTGEMDLNFGKVLVKPYVKVGLWDLFHAKIENSIIGISQSWDFSSYFYSQNRALMPWSESYIRPHVTSDFYTGNDRKFKDFSFQVELAAQIRDLLGTIDVKASVGYKNFIQLQMGSTQDFLNSLSLTLMSTLPVNLEGVQERNSANVLQMTASFKLLAPIDSARIQLAGIQIKEMNKEPKPVVFGLFGFHPLGKSAPTLDLFLNNLLFKSSSGFDYILHFDRDDVQKTSLLTRRVWNKQKNSPNFNINSNTALPVGQYYSILDFVLDYEKILAKGQDCLNALSPIDLQLVEDLKEFIKKVNELIENSNPSPSDYNELNVKVRQYVESNISRIIINAKVHNENRKYLNSISSHQKLVRGWMNWTLNFMTSDQVNQVLSGEVNLLSENLSDRQKIYLRMRELDLKFQEVLDDEGIKSYLIPNEPLILLDHLKIINFKNA